MKKRKQFLLPVLLACLLLAACGKSKDALTTEPPSDANTKEPEIVELYTSSPTYRPSEETGDQEHTGTDEASAQTVGTGETAHAASPEAGADNSAGSAKADFSWKLIAFSNSTLSIKFAYPEGWINEPGVDTITFVEPVEEGDTPARFSVTSYEFTGAKSSTSLLKNELGACLKKIYAEYNEYKTGTVLSNLTIADSKAVHCDYLAVKGNGYIKGFLGVGYGKNGRVYMIHFCCSEEDYASFKPLIYKLSQSITVLNKK
ncbi:MAG: hypothetical protein J5859_00520 [Clostridia bacterium]|nr:hypothetical protein [Clostridia bacterium]